MLTDLSKDHVLQLLDLSATSILCPLSPAPSVSPLAHPPAFGVCLFVGKMRSRNALRSFDPITWLAGSGEATEGYLYTGHQGTLFAFYSDFQIPNLKGAETE